MSETKDDPGCVSGCFLFTLMIGLLVAISMPVIHWWFSPIPEGDIMCEGVEVPLSETRLGDMWNNITNDEESPDER